MLSPLALLWLLPIGGAITLLYLLKQKRQDKTVPSLLLWEQVLAETAAASPFQKLRIDPLLVLQLLAALLLAVALARPFIWGNAVGGKNVAIVLDASASMSATDVSGGRFAVAVSEARKLVDAKAPSDSMALVLAGPRPETLSPLTNDKSKLLGALNRAEPTDAVNGPREAVLLAGSLVTSRRDAGVTLITDGAFARQDELSLGQTAFQTIVVGKGSANVGITAFDVREEGGGTSALQAFASVMNADDTPRTVTLEIRAGDALLDAREITVPGGETRSVTVLLDPAKLPQNADLLTARIDTRDDLAADNEAYAALPSRSTVKVLLVSSGDDPFLERALSLAARVQVQRTSPGAFSAKDVAAVNLVVWDSDTAPPIELPKGRYLFFGAVPPGKNSPVTANGGVVEGVTVLDWDRASPLLRFSNLSGVHVRAAQKVNPAPWATVAVESKSAPLVVAGEHAGTRIAYVAFRPTQSDFPLRVAFPVFVANAVSYLATTSETETARVLRPGDTAPNGGNTSKVGKHKGYAVALLSPSETSITPQPTPPLIITDTNDKGATDPAKSRKAPREWWMYLAAPLLLLLLGEWFVFHRFRR